MRLRPRTACLALLACVSVLFFVISSRFIAQLGDRDDALLAEQDYIDDGRPAGTRRSTMKMADGDRRHAVPTWEWPMVALDWGAQVGNPWSVAAQWVDAMQIHPDVPDIGAVLRAMATREITKADVGYLGSQLKMTLLLSGGQRVVFKPLWYKRDFVVNDTEPYAGLDRHNGEIAAFHLNRMLGLNRAPLVVGRVIDLQAEIIPVASKRLLKTFFRRGDNDCFYGECHYCKGPDTGVCAAGSRLEGAVILWLSAKWKLKKYPHPWRRTYNTKRRAKWEVDHRYCGTVRRMPLYRAGRRLLDIVDTAIFDFLIGNADRHHYETLDGEADSMVVLVDNGKSFGNPYRDEMSILAPLVQCCKVRASTVARMKRLTGGLLSAVLRDTLQDDPVTPVLADLHLRALDRRLAVVSEVVAQCSREDPAAVIDEE